MSDREPNETQYERVVRAMCEAPSRDECLRVIDRMGASLPSAERATLGDLLYQIWPA